MEMPQNYKSWAQSKVQGDHFSDTSLTFSKIPDITLTAVKFPDISRFASQVVTL